MRRMITRASKPELTAQANALNALIHTSLAHGHLDLLNTRRGVAVHLQPNRSMLQFRLKKLGIFPSLEASLDESPNEAIISPFAAM